MSPQIGQAIEEVNSNNQELLRKYRRELQLRKKCHNELVRLKGGCGRAPHGVLCRLRAVLPLPRPSTTPWSSETEQSGPGSVQPRGPAGPKQASPGLGAEWLPRRRF